MSRLQRLWLACAAAMVLSGCMSIGRPGGAGPAGPGSAHSPTGQALSPAEAQALLTPGASTRPQVAAALGTAVVIHFDSGHEVWVYRWWPPGGTIEQATELVLLFPPQGPLARWRVKPGSSGRTP